MSPSPDHSPEGPAADGAAPSLKVRAVRSFLWSALSFGSSRVIVFVVTLVLARLLAPSDFGVVAAGLTLIAFLEIALDLGVGAAVIYEQEEGVTRRVRTAYTLNITIALVLALLGVLAAPAIADFFGSADQTPLFRTLFGYLVLRGGAQVQMALLQRDLRYRERTVVDVSRAAVRGCASIALAFAGTGAWAIVLGLLAGELVALVVASHYVRMLPALRIDRSVATSLLRFGAGVLGIKVVSAFLTNSDNVIVGGRLGPEQLGLYAMAYRLPELTITTVHWIFSSVAFALYAKARLQGPEAFRETMLRALRLTTMFGFSAAVGLAIAAPLAVPLLFSDRWSAAVGPTICLALATGLASIGYASGDIFPAVGRPAALLRLTATLTVFALVGFWFAAPFGITAVAAVHLAFQVVFGTLRLRAANRLVGSSWRENATAMAPALISVSGIVLLALPVSLLLPAGPLALVATVISGIVGALLALQLLAKGALHESLALLRTGTRQS